MLQRVCSYPNPNCKSPFFVINFAIFCDLMIGVLPWGPVEVLTPPLTKRRIENAKNLTNA